jgi:hypothetical protein
MFLHSRFKPLNAELNPICHLLGLLGAHPILHISGIRVNPYPTNVESRVNIFRLFLATIIAVERNKCYSF